MSKVADRVEAKNQALQEPATDCSERGPRERCLRLIEGQDRGNCIRRTGGSKGRRKKAGR